VISTALYAMDCMVLTKLHRILLHNMIGLTFGHRYKSRKDGLIRPEHRRLQGRKHRLMQMSQLHDAGK
jgi:hypothetical protein